MHLEPATRRSPSSTRIASVARNALGNHQPAVRAVVERALEELHAVRLVRVRLERDRRSARATRCARERIGLRLYAIADEPICSCSNGSSISPNACSMRRSPLNFAALAAMPRDARRAPARRACASTSARTPESTSRNPIFAVTQPVELAHLRVVAVEDLEKARLRSRRALHAAAAAASRCGGRGRRGRARDPASTASRACRPSSAAPAADACSRASARRATRARTSASARSTSHASRRAAAPGRGASESGRRCR